MWESHLERKKKKKTLFNDLKFGKSKTLLFCCNGYSHAIFFFFLWISSRITEKKHLQKKKKEKKC